MSNDKKTNAIEDKKPASKKGAKKPASKPASKPQQGTQAPKKLGKIAMHYNGAEFTEKRPGVLALIVRLCVNATQAKPISKRKLLELVFAEFPTRIESELKKTCSGQLPCQLRGEKGIIMREKIVDDVATGEYYFDAKATDEKRAEQGRTPLMTCRQIGGGENKLKPVETTQE
jgi:hypothetical protein